MAAGEYVSVSSQADSEHADLARERQELVDNPEGEVKELAGIYVGRGVESELARQVAEQLMASDALGAHAREELGITDLTVARPVQAAMASAAAFSVGAILPVVMALLAPNAIVVRVVSAASLVFLALLGALGARTGGANPLRAAHSRDVLGRARHGGDGAHRRDVRDACVSLAAGLTSFGPSDGPGIMFSCAKPRFATLSRGAPDLVTSIRRANERTVSRLSSSAPQHSKE